MNIGINKKLLNEAIKEGCRTVAELALFIRKRANP